MNTVGFATLFLQTWIFPALYSLLSTGETSREAFVGNTFSKEAVHAESASSISMRISPYTNAG